MASGRRLAVLVVALALIGAPAVALRALCVGKSCAEEASAPAPVPFCPLPADLRAQIEAGYRQGRSPDVMAATADVALFGGMSGIPGAPWPEAPYTTDQNRVPIILFGHGIVPGALPRNTGVDRIAPTIAELIGLHRPHPEVRSGTLLKDFVRTGVAPSLVVEIVWDGVGSDAFTQVGAPWTDGIAFGGHAAQTFWGTTGSLPADPAATLTTIGTGGLPSQHGITGTLIRNANGATVRAWSSRAPTSVIATLPDDWDHATGQQARIGLVAHDRTDQGLVGGNWYLSHDRDDLEFGRDDPVAAVGEMLAAGYGSDATTDIVAVVLTGITQRVDAQTRRIVSAIRRQVPDTTFVVTATGPTSAADATAVGVAADVNTAVDAPVVTAAVPGGLFLNQAVMAAKGITSDDVVRAMDALTAPDGTLLFADAYPGFAISFSRYC